MKSELFREPHFAIGTSIPIKRREIARILNELDPKLAGFYLGGVTVLADTANPARAYLAAHAGRDFIDRFPEYLGVMRSKPPNKDEKNSARKQLYSSLLGYPSEDGHVKSWISVQNSFVGLAHFRAREESGPDINQVEMLFDQLDQLILAFKGPFFRMTRELEKLMTVDSPNDEQVAEAIRLLALPARRRFFFYRLSKPGWLKPLISKGFFAFPVEGMPEGEDQEEWHSYRQEAGYLERSADAQPDAAVEVIKELIGENKPRKPKDPWIAMKLVKTCSIIPPGKVAPFAKRLSKWISIKSPPIDASVFSDLAIRLAKSGHSEESIAISERLFSIFQPAPELRDNVEDDNELSFAARLTKPRYLMSDHEYVQLLSKTMPACREVDTSNTKKLLCHLLKRALKFTHPSIEGKPKEDYSFIWLPSIDEPERDDPKSHLAYQLWKTIHYGLKNNPESLPECIHKLEKEEWPIFKRMTLRALIHFGQHDLRLTRKYCLDISLFRDGHYSQDYMDLLETRFGELDEEPRLEFPDRIEADLAMEFRRREESEVNEERRQQDLLRRLNPISKHLVGEWRQRFDELTIKYGKPTRIPRLRPAEARILGWKSPRTSEELIAMSDADLIKFLKSYAPESQDIFDAPTRTGLGMELGKAVEKDPIRFGRLAEKFRYLPSIYADYLISGLREATDFGPAFPWDEVLVLALFFSAEPESVHEVREADTTNRRSTVRNEITELFLHAFNAKTPPLLRLRKRIWAVLADLSNTACDFMDKDVEVKGSSELMKWNVPVDAAARTTAAIMEYTLWVGRTTAWQDIGPGKRGMEAVPEIAEFLLELLSRDGKSAKSIRKVVGINLSQIIWMDSEWFEQNHRLFFPEKAERQILGQTLWNSFIVNKNPHPTSFASLRSDYRKALEALKAEMLDFSEPDIRLGVHLVILFLQGELDLVQPDSLLNIFLTEAPAALKSKSFDEIAHNLYATKERLPDMMEKRLCDLWSNRLQKSMGLPSPALMPELQALSGFLDYRWFDGKWAIEALGQTLEQTKGRISRDFAIAERLATLSGDFPSEALFCLSLIRSCSDNKQMFSFRETEFRTVLSNALASSDPDSRRQAVREIDKLGEMGFTEYGELLKEIDPKNETVL